jgi:hypothetical protein
MQRRLQGRDKRHEWVLGQECICDGWRIKKEDRIGMKHASKQSVDQLGVWDFCA